MTDTKRAARQLRKVDNPDLGRIIDAYFAEATGLPTIRVGVVDSGVEPSALDHVQIEAGIAINSATHVVAEAPTDAVGHGTAVARIISRLAPHSTIVPIRVLDDDLTCSLGSLTTAIQWALDNELDLVNLSLGTVSVSPGSHSELEDACMRAADRGLLLCAASPATGDKVYPAMLRSTVSVTAGDIPRPYSFFRCVASGVDFVARGGMQRVRWGAHEERFLHGSSFACAHVTGVAAVLASLGAPADLAGWRTLLNKMVEVGEAPLIAEQSMYYVPKVVEGKPRSSVSVVRGDRNGHPLSWIERAALFPFNKEMHALIRFRESLSFDIVSVGDLLARCQVGRDPAAIIGAGSSSLKIVHKHDALFSGADTLILGHLEVASEVSQSDLRYRMAAEALERGLNVFSFTPLTAYPGLQRLAREKGVQLYSPGVDEDSYNAVRDLLNEPETSADIPVLGVMGTARSQGKFTFQLLLRHQLLKRGYRVGQIGTEPHSELFGCDSTLPLGHQAANALPLANLVTYLECKFEEIARNVRPDIFLFGGQGPLLSHFPGFPKSFSSRGQSPGVPAELITTILLTGLKPDALVLAVNAFDEPEQVRRCRSAVESIAYCKVLALAVSDQKKEVKTTYGRQWLKTSPYADGELEETLQKLEGEHGLPAFAPAVDSGAVALTDVVVDFFASFGSESRAG